VALATIVYLAPPAAAAPIDLLAKKLAQAKALEAKIEAANKRADKLDEQYLDARNAVATSQHGIEVAARAYADGQRRAAEIRDRVRGRAAALYMSSQTPSFLFGFDATNAAEIGTDAKYNEAATAPDVQLLKDIAQSSRALISQRAELEHRQEAARGRQKRLDRNLRDLKKATAQQQQLLATVNTDIAGLVSEIALQRAIAMEVAARASLAKQLPGVTQLPTFGANVGGDLSTNIGVDPGIYPGPTPGADAAVAFARQQIGDPYVYAGAGPNIWDCSGLTMVAWSHGGVTMDHSAQDQYKMFTKVPLAQLQPGDLVFFGNPIHHVAIYVGAGTMIEAPHTGAYVRFASIFRDDLVLQGVRPNAPPPPVPPPK